MNDTRKTRLTLKTQPHVKVMDKLVDLGYEAYLVGGCVRDHLLNRTSKDYDVTTNATPEQVQAAFEHTIPVGAQFGVIVVVMEGEQIEVATYRADGQYSDGRRPDSVSFSTNVKDDVTRRDFTINGLLMDRFGVITDHVFGQSDIDAGIIRAIGNPNKRFTEDALRMLRAVRFAAQLGFEIEAGTYEAIERNARLLQCISHERIAIELFKIVSSKFPLQGLLPLFTSGLCDYALPQEYRDSCNFIQTLRRFTKFQTSNPVLGMAMFMADTPSHLTLHTANFLKLSGEERSALVGATLLVPSITRSQTMSLANRKRIVRQDGFTYALTIFEQNKAIGKTHLLDTEVAEILAEFKSFTPEDIRPVPLVTGKDLIEMGLPPGPIFTELLDEIETGQLNGTLDRKTALENIRDRVYRDDRGEIVVKPATKGVTL